MINTSVTIIDKIGFHVRTASMFSKIAGEFTSKIEVNFNEKKVNGKSTLALMTLGVKNNNTINISVSGEDEENALQRLKKLVEENFNQ